MQKLHSGCILTTTTLQVWIQTYQVWNLSAWKSVCGFCFHTGKQVPSSQCRVRAAPQAHGLCDLPSSPLSAFVEAIDLVQEFRMSAISQVKGSFLFSFSQGIAFIISSPSSLCWQTSLLLPQPQSFPSGTVPWRGRGRSFWQGTAVSSMFTAPLTGPEPSWSHGQERCTHAWRAFCSCTHQSCVIHKNMTCAIFIIYPLRLASLQMCKCDCTPRTCFPIRDFSTWPCMGWRHFLDHFMP